jgi:uncharacterized SAM-binding protein YcdF (DUF218 family)
MTKRLLAFAVLLWAAGFVWFATSLPEPHRAGRTDAVVVLTGGEGRIARGLEVLRRGWSKRMLVSGVDRNVRPHEFQLEYKVSPALMACCVTLGFESVDTRSNAQEVSAWIARHRLRSVRLVTSDWHMRRAELEIRRRVPDRVVLLRDGIATQPSLRILFLEYNKWLARRISGLWGD